MDTTADQGLTDQAKEKATTAASATQDVAQSAAEQVTQVASEAAMQAQDLLGAARDQLRTQAEEQARKLADTVRSAVEELRQMASSAGENATTKQLVQGIADKGASLAEALENRGPAGLFGDLQDVGRRRPGMFLLGALAAGVAAGRLGRAAMSASPPTPTGTAGSMARSERPATSMTPGTAYSAGETGLTTGSTGAMAASETSGWGGTPATDRMAEAGGLTEVTGTATDLEGAGTSGMVTGPTSSESTGTPLPPRGREDSETVVLPSHGHRTQ